MLASDRHLRKGLITQISETVDFQDGAYFHRFIRVDITQVSSYSIKYHIFRQKLTRLIMSTHLTALFILFACCSIQAQNIPVDFEAGGNGADWNWTVFENGTNPGLEFIENPDPSGINSSPTVASFSALQVGAPWAGCESMHGSDIGSFTIDVSNKIIRIMVWKSAISDIGIKLVRFDNWSLGEIKIANTMVNEWEQISFDFSAHIGLTYDQIVIFPDFIARNEDRVIYFDNVWGEEAMTSGVSDSEAQSFDFGPNPVKDDLSISSEKSMEELTISDLGGRVLFSSNEASLKKTIDISSFDHGVYLLSVRMQDEWVTKRIVKE